MLQVVTDGDLDEMLSWARTPLELFQWSGGSLTFPLTVEQLRRYALDASPNHRAFKFMDEANEFAGYLELCNINRNNDSCSMSRVVVAPDRRCTGIGKRMVSAAVREALVTLGLHRISLFVFDFNPGAIRCYEHAGFKREGLLREAYKHGDKYWNVYVMSVLKSDLPLE